MLWDSFSVRTMKLTPVSRHHLFVAPHTPAEHWGLGPPQRDETIRPPTATLIGWHWTRTCGWAVLTFRVTCILSFALIWTNKFLPLRLMTSRGLCLQCGSHGVWNLCSRYL